MQSVKLAYSIMVIPHILWVIVSDPRSGMSLLHLSCKVTRSTALGAPNEARRHTRTIPTSCWGIEIFRRSKKNGLSEKVG